MRRRTGLAPLLALALIGSACSSDYDELPPPPPTSSTTSTTGAPDLSNIDLDGVPGATTTSVVMGPGRAALRGSVIGPDGPVAGAHVRVERLVDGGIATVDLTTGAEATWEVTSVLGGRYRIRAWRTPDLAQVKPTIVFLESTEERQIALRVDLQSGVVAEASIAPDPPIVREPANLVVQVTHRSVDDAGVVSGDPIAGVRLELYGNGWTLESANPVVADGNGRGRWTIRCDSAGNQPLSVVVGSEQAVPVSVSACATTPPPTTAPPGGGAPGRDGPPGDGTTRPTSRQSTTSTTRRTTTTTSG